MSDVTILQPIATEKPVKLTKKGLPYKKIGGPRPGSGRPRRMDEEQIIAKLQPMAETAFRVLHQKVHEGDMKAIQLYLQYFIGLPTQKVENKIEGNLNTVQIEVIKPTFTEVPEVVESN